MAESASCCGSNNCLNPNAPEYGKCRKPENNSGCSCSCNACTEDESEDETTRVVRQNLTREDFIG